eukprot:g7655.t1
MASQKQYPELVGGRRPVAATAVGVHSFGVEAEEFSVAAALLAQGIKVTFRSYKKGGSNPQDGNLQLDGIGNLVFIPIGKKNRHSNQVPTTTTVASIDEVLLEAGGDGNVCRVLMKDGATGPSFSVQCAVDVEGFSRSHMTKFVAAVLRESRPTQKKDELLEKARWMTTFAEMLEPLGLVEKYDSKFQQCGILFENLSVVTRDDLAEVVGITDRVDQINIMGQIKRSGILVVTFKYGAGGRQQGW